MNAVSIAVNLRGSDCRMRPTWMWTADAKRRWWFSLAASAVLGVPACASSVGVRAVEHALIAEIGPPLPDAKVVGTPWFQGVGVWYDHRNDAPTVLAWLEAIPARLGSTDFTSDQLTPSDAWRAGFYRCTCRLELGGRRYVVKVTTLLTPTSTSLPSSTVVVAYHDA